MAAFLAGAALTSAAVSAGPVGAASSHGVAITIYPGMRYPTGIVAGPDGALWFTNNGNPLPRDRHPPSGVDHRRAGRGFTETGGTIGRITTAGKVNTYFVGVGLPQAITAGPDGALWFTEIEFQFGGQLLSRIGRITTGGVRTFHTDTYIHYIHLQNGDIAAGPDGAVWFTINHTNSIGRIATPG